MQDLIKESASDFRNKFKSRLYYIIRLYKKGEDTTEKQFISDILDWHTKQMEKAYKKGRSENIERRDVQWWTVLKYNVDEETFDRIRLALDALQANTLGTTMEERLATEYKEYENREVELSREKIIRFWLKELAQSKTDLLNALIEREELMRIKDFDIETGLQFGDASAYNHALDDTINHLKSLRDE